MIKLGKALLALLKPGIEKVKPLFSTVWSAIKKKTRIEQLSKLSIRHRLIFFVLVIAIMPIVIMGWVSVSNSESAITNKITKYSARELVQSSTNLTSAFQKYEEYLMQYLAYREQNQLVSAYTNTPANNSTALMENYKRLDKYIGGATILMPDLARITIYPLNDKAPVTVSVNNSGESSLNPEFFDEPANQAKKKAFFKEIREYKMRWNTFGNFIVCGRLVKDLDTGDELAIITLFISKKRLDQMVNSPLYTDPDYSDDWLNNQPYSILINNEGQIITSPITADIDQNITVLMNNHKALQKIANGTNNYKAKFHRQTVTVTSNFLWEKNWYIVNLTPDSYLYSEVNKVKVLAILLGIVISFIAVYVSLRFTNSIATPLTRVMTAMQHAESGDLSAQVKIKTQDELGQLGTSFNRMISEINELVLQIKSTITEVLYHSKTLGESSTTAAEAARMISSVAEEISKGTTVQTTEAENTASKMGELADKISGAATKS
ncbi:MAG TPA: methyl-accepting chemotaxis protein, partial [Bacillota bacterium]|nr:methyl-accepting chemotaxis protein [Bacillota bacterium]